MTAIAAVGGSLQPMSPESRAQILGLGAVHFARLPLPATLTVAGSGLAARAIVVSTSPRLLEAARRQTGVVGFSGAEWDALTVAAENDRASVVSLRRWVLRKGSQRWWDLREKDALDGLILPEKSKGWTIGRVLSAWRLTLEKCSVGDEIPT